MLNSRTKTKKAVCSDEILNSLIERYGPDFDIRVHSWVKGMCEENSKKIPYSAYSQEEKSKLLELMKLLPELFQHLIKKVQSNDVWAEAKVIPNRKLRLN